MALTAPEMASVCRVYMDERHAALILPAHLAAVVRAAVETDRGSVGVASSSESARRARKVISGEPTERQTRGKLKRHSGPLYMSFMTIGAARGRTASPFSPGTLQVAAERRLQPIATKPPVQVPRGRVLRSRDLGRARVTARRFGIILRTLHTP